MLRGEEKKAYRYLFENVAENVICIWSLSRLFGASPGLSIGRAAAEHAGKRAEKVARCIWVAGPLGRRSTRGQPVILAASLWIREHIVRVCDSLGRLSSLSRVPGTVNPRVGRTDLKLLRSHPLLFDGRIEEPIRVGPRAVIDKKYKRQATI